jgi:hypothetical protein
MAAERARKGRKLVLRPVIRICGKPRFLTIYLHQFFCEDGPGVVAGFMFFVASSLA